MREVETSSNTISQARLSKVSWLSNDQHKVVETLSQRTADMTGLNMLTAEALQIANYGIGGHYEPHYDFFSDKKTRRDNDRIATVLFYVCVFSYR